MAGATHLLLTLGGSYRSGPGAGTEIWQTGVRLGLQTHTGDPDAIGPLSSFDVKATSVSRVETGWTITSNWYATAGAHDFDCGDFLNDQAGPAAKSLIASASFASDTQLDWLKLYPISSPDGHVEPAPPFAQGSPALLSYTGTHPSGTGSQGLPFQASLTGSLRTGQVGRRGRGRMFMPPSPVSIMSNLVAGSTATAAMALNIKTFLEALRISVGGGTNLYTWPIVTGKPFTEAAAVTEVSVSNVLDTQQRRRRSVPETRSSQVVDPFA